MRSDCAIGDVPVDTVRKWVTITVRKTVRVSVGIAVDITICGYLKRPVEIWNRKSFEEWKNTMIFMEVVVHCDKFST
jgi:hypothetical protein